MLQRSQVSVGLGFPSPHRLHSRSRLAVGEEVPARHSWLSSEYVSISSLLAQFAVSVKKTFWDVSAAHLIFQVSIAFGHLENTAVLCMVAQAQGFASEHVKSPDSYLWLWGFCLSWPCRAQLSCVSLQPRAHNERIFILLESILGRAHWWRLLLAGISICHSLSWGSFSWYQGTERWGFPERYDAPALNSPPWSRVKCRREHACSSEVRYVFATWLSTPVSREARKCLCTKEHLGG